MYILSYTFFLWPETECGQFKLHLVHMTQDAARLSAWKWRK